jgi:hypothetical protein
MRDRTASRNYSPERDQFRREHERRRAYGLQRRHAERLRRLHESRPANGTCRQPGRPDVPWADDAPRTLGVTPSRPRDVPRTREAPQPAPPCDIPPARNVPRAREVPQPAPPATSRQGAASPHPGHPTCPHRPRPATSCRRTTYPHPAPATCRHPKPATSRRRTTRPHPEPATCRHPRPPRANAQNERPAPHRAKPLQLDGIPRDLSDSPSPPAYPRISVRGLPAPTGRSVRHKHQPSATGKLGHRCAEVRQLPSSRPETSTHL